MIFFFFTCLNQKQNELLFVCILHLPLFLLLIVLRKLFSMKYERYIFFLFAVLIIFNVVYPDSLIQRCLQKEKISIGSVIPWGWTEKLTKKFILGSFPSNIHPSAEKLFRFYFMHNDAFCYSMENKYISKTRKILYELIFSSVVI